MLETANLALPLNGERYLPELGSAIHPEHLHRYLDACEMVAGCDVLDVACGELISASAAEANTALCCNPPAETLIQRVHKKK